MGLARARMSNSNAALLEWVLCTPPLTPEAPAAASPKKMVGLRQLILDMCGEVGARLRPGETLRLMAAAAAAAAGGKAGRGRPWLPLSARGLGGRRPPRSSIAGCSKRPQGACGSPFCETR